MPQRGVFGNEKMKISPCLFTRKKQRALNKSLILLRLSANETPKKNEKASQKNEKQSNR